MGEIDKKKNIFVDKITKDTIFYQLKTKKPLSPSHTNHYNIKALNYYKMPYPKKIHLQHLSSEWNILSPT